MVVIRAEPLATALWIQCFLHMKNLIRGGLLCDKQVLVTGSKGWVPRFTTDQQTCLPGLQNNFSGGAQQAPAAVGGFPLGTVKPGWVKEAVTQRDH